MSSKQEYVPIRITLEEFKNPRGRYQDEVREKLPDFSTWLRQSIDVVRKSLEQNDLSDAVYEIVPLGIGQADILVSAKEAFRVYSLYKTMHINDEFTSKDLLTRTIGDEHVDVGERLLHYKFFSKYVIPHNDQTNMWRNERLSTIKARQTSLLLDQTKKPSLMAAALLHMLTLISADVDVIGSSQS